MAVKVQFEIGHHSKLRSKKSPEGFTHDWELYVQGVNNADISTFVEKIIFILHDTFPKPRRVLKSPPYSLQESGYAGFTIPIDIYFQNTDEPKRFHFEYDLDLQNSGPPQHRNDVKNFIFESPSEEFRAKLLKGGGVPVAGVVSGGGINETRSLVASSSLGNDDGGGMVSKPKLSGSGNDKKHKSRPDDSKLSTFATLFGPPITKSSKPSPDNRTTIGNSSSAVNTTNNSTLGKEKSSKDKSSSSSGEKTKEKTDKKDKHKQNSPHKDKEKKSSSSEKRSSESKKDKTRDKDHESKRDKSNSNNSRDSSIQKRPTTSHTTDLSGTSPKKANPVSPRLPTNDSKLVTANSVSKPSDNSGENKVKDSSKTKEQSSSSGKKSKKDKKDKDKERDREKDREKQRSSDSKPKEANASNAVDAIAGGASANDSKKTTLPAPQINKSSSGSSNNSTTKKVDKDAKQHSLKVPEKPMIEKESSNHATSATPNNAVSAEKSEKKSSSSKDHSSEKDKKSHKHKKKDKSKDKDKERERERDKEKHKDREREKEKDKHDDKKVISSETQASIAGGLNEITKPDILANTANNAVATAGKAPSSATSIATLSSGSSNSGTPTSILSTSNANNNNTTSVSPTKKSLSKEKKSKEKSSRDELKRQRDADTGDAAAIAKKKTKSSSSSNKSAAHDLELSDMDSVLSASDVLASNSNTNATPGAASSSTTVPTAIEPSDSSNSSFPDLPTKSRSNILQTHQKASGVSTSSPIPPPAASTKDSSKAKVNSSQSSNSSSNTIAKDSSKQRSEKATKSSEKSEKLEKSEKSEKDNKKRKRSSNSQQQQPQIQTASPATNTFIEPPVKQAKKEQTKGSREKSKSPALRGPSPFASNTIGLTPYETTTNTNNAANTPISTPVMNAFLPPPPAAASAANASPRNNTHPPYFTSSVVNNNNSIASNNLNNSATSGNEPIVSPATATSAVANHLSATATTTPIGTPTGTTISTGAGMSSTMSLSRGDEWPTEYLNELQELHHKIMTLQDNEELQQVVEMIAATGCYEITNKTFDFDLCKLDRSTVQRLQEFIATCTS